MNEEWRDIQGYEGFYQVSNLGRVKSLDRFDGFQNNVKGKILKKYISETGYERACLSKNNKTKKFQVHRLVATAFIPNPDNKPQVNHIDECRSNNNFENLEWCTAQYNSKYGSRPNKISALKSKPIISISSSGLMRYFKSITAASKSLNVNFQNISSVIKGRRKHAGGYYFKFVNLEER